MTNGTPPPTWPVEPTTLFVVSYYPTNSLNEAPSNVAVTMRTFNEAVDKAKELIVAASNVGVCVIQQVSCSVVYPSVPWEDF